MEDLGGTNVECLFFIKGAFFCKTLISLTHFAFMIIKLYLVEALIYEIFQKWFDFPDFVLEPQCEAMLLRIVEAIRPFSHLSA